MGRIVRAILNVLQKENFIYPVKVSICGRRSNKTLRVGSGPIRYSVIAPRGKLKEQNTENHRFNDVCIGSHRDFLAPLRGDMFPENRVSKREHGINSKRGGLAA